MTSLTARERKLLEEIPKHTSVKEAAQYLGLSESTAYAILFRVRKKLKDSEEFVNNIRSMRRREPTLTKVLTYRD